MQAGGVPASYRACSPQCCGSKLSIAARQCSLIVAPRPRRCPRQPAFSARAAPGFHYPSADVASCRSIRDCDTFCFFHSPECAQKRGIAILARPLPIPLFVVDCSFPRPFCFVPRRRYRHQWQDSNGPWPLGPGTITSFIPMFRQLPLTSLISAF